MFFKKKNFFYEWFNFYGIIETGVYIMKKKKLEKKLMLKIEKIANLNHHEMRETKGMTALIVCSESCSALDICCDYVYTV